MRTSCRFYGVTPAVTPWPGGRLGASSVTTREGGSTWTPYGDPQLGELPESRVRRNGVHSMTQYHRLRDHWSGTSGETHLTPTPTSGASAPAEYCSPDAAATL
jgi:hypothetical protein